MSNVHAYRMQVGQDEFAVIAVSVDEVAALRRLTAAENEVVEFLRSGASNKAIAQHRGTADRTVANQIASIYRKLGISSRAELLALIMDGRFKNSDRPTTASTITETTMTEITTTKTTNTSQQ